MLMFTNKELFYVIYIKEDNLFGLYFYNNINKLN
jgi:hypothetical protein